MEITLEMLFWSLLGSACLVVLLQLFSIKQKQRIQHGLEQNQHATSQQQAATKTDLEQQLNNNKQAQDKLYNQLSEQLADYFTVLKDMHNQAEQRFTEITQQLQLALQQLAEQQTEYSNQLSQTDDKLRALAQQHALQAQDALNTHTKQLQQQQSTTQAELIQRLEHLKSVSQSMDFNQQQAKLSLLEQLTSQLQSLRTDNLVSLTNELAKHQELRIENDDFVKQLGDCKVTKIKDKHSGQISHLIYQDGLKQRSDTYAEEQLKYQMHFDETGKPQQGLEFDEQGNCIFEYHYNAAGEIEQRIENRFDESGKQIEQVAVAY